MTQVEEDVILTDPTLRGTVKIEEPLFSIKLEPYFQPIDESNFEEEDLPEYIPPPFGNSKPEDFVILYHVRLEISKPKDAVEGDKIKEEEELAEEEYEAGFNENQVYKRKTIPNISSKWLRLTPGL